MQFDNFFRSSQFQICLLVADMYGLICENVSSFIKYKYGDDTWDNIRRLANIDSPTFSVHKVLVEYHDQKLFKL